MTLERTPASCAKLPRLKTDQFWSRTRGVSRWKPSRMAPAARRRVRSGGRHNLPHAAQFMDAAGGEVNLSRLERVKRIGQASEWPGLRAGDVRDTHGHGASHQHVCGIQRLNRLRQKLVPATLTIQDVSEDGGEEFLPNRLEESLICREAHTKWTVSSRQRCFGKARPTIYSWVSFWSVIRGMFGVLGHLSGTKATGQHPIHYEFSR